MGTILRPLLLDSTRAFNYDKPCDCFSCQSIFEAYSVDMNSLRNTATRTPSNVQFISVARPAAHAAVYRRLLQQNQTSNLRSRFLPDEIAGPGLASSRSFHQSSRLGKEKPAAEAPKEEPAEGESAKKASAEDAESAPGEKEEAKKEGESEGEEGKKEEKEKEAPPPPPPHGDKSPWQVFTETLQTEFKASKEWNESTKALAAGAQQFTENESVRRAREAYEQTTGAVSSTTAKALKGTAGAVGKGAAWTWETPVVKGVRTTVNATASVIEKGTRPIRETEAYKNVKNVIDDGS